MHELSIALSMMDRIREEAARHSGAVRSVQVKIGVLSGVDTEALRFAWEIARAGTELEQTELQIESVSLRVRCPECGEVYSPEIFSLACPRCVTPALDILEGKELELTSLEMDS